MQKLKVAKFEQTLNLFPLKDKRFLKKKAFNLDMQVDRFDFQRPVLQDIALFPAYNTCQCSYFACENHD